MEYIDWAATFTFLGVFIAITTGVFLVAISLRRVVDANMVHVVVSSKKTTNYGKGEGAGNVYYEWPSWVPVLGVTNTKLPTSIFDIDLNNYDAYDKERLPFVVDIMSFFRVTDPGVAAQRVSNFDELRDQLESIVQGAVRSILAKNELEFIMEDRSTFGEKFTKEVEGQLIEWGVEAVKNIELMDIRDAKDSQVVHNIMAKKKSFIEMESRREVAENRRIAEIAEINAKKEIDMQGQDAAQAVGLRRVENEREVALSEEKAKQLIQDQTKTTREKEMAVIKVQSVKQAEIDKEVEIVKAEQDKQKSIVMAEGKKQQTVLVADGDREAKMLEAQGIEAEGNARAEAEKASQLASVTAQTELAKEIGSNKEYQEYLINIEKVKASRDIGIEQAKALNKADIKVITNSGSPSSGLTNVMDIFSAKGGTEIGAMLEALGNTDKGSELLNKASGTKPINIQ